jgi:hypothetical protein
MSQPLQGIAAAFDFARDDGKGVTGGGGQQADARFRAVLDGVNQSGRLCAMSSKLRRSSKWTAASNRPCAASRSASASSATARSVSGAQVGAVLRLASAQETGKERPGDRGCGQNDHGDGRDFDLPPMPGQKLPQGPTCASHSSASPSRLPRA